jgi:hypothetical protein
MEERTLMGSGVKGLVLLDHGSDQPGLTERQANCTGGGVP